MSQTKYAKSLLQKFKMENCKPVATPLTKGLKLSKHDTAEKFDGTLYRQLVCSLIYLCSTRADIAHATGLLSQFMHCPTVTHWQEAKRVLRYLQGTLTHGLHYAANCDISLSGFIDSDWSGDMDDRKSTTGYCFSLGSACISWLSKKQDRVSLSSSEAEYRAANAATTEAMWLRKLMFDLHHAQHGEATSILCDSVSCIAIGKNPVFHARMKHIENHYHYVRDCIQDGFIDLIYCPTEDNVADIFTKSLSAPLFTRHRHGLGIRDITTMSGGVIK